MWPSLPQTGMGCTTGQGLHFDPGLWYKLASLKLGGGQTRSRFSRQNVRANVFSRGFDLASNPVAQPLTTNASPALRVGAAFSLLRQSISEMTQGLLVGEGGQGRGGFVCD